MVMLEKTLTFLNALMIYKILNCQLLSRHISSYKNGNARKNLNFS